MDEQRGTAAEAAASAGAGRPAAGTARTVADVDTLKALTHPLRMRMLGHLRMHGAATASSLARTFGESSGTTSYHLRQLERYGFVQPAAEQPSRRDKVWEAAHELTRIELPDEDRRAAAPALGALTEGQLASLVEGVRRRSHEAEAWGPDWRAAHLGDDLPLRITPDRLQQLKKDLERLVAAAAAEPDAYAPEARLVVLHLHSYPAEGQLP